MEGQVIVRIRGIETVITTKVISPMAYIFCPHISHYLHDTAEGIYNTPKRDVYDIVYIENNRYRFKQVVISKEYVSEISDNDICDVDDVFFMRTNIYDDKMNLVEGDIISSESATNIFGLREYEYYNIIIPTNIEKHAICRFGTHSTHMVTILKNSKDIRIKNTIYLGNRQYGEFDVHCVKIQDRLSSYLISVKNTLNDDPTRVFSINRDNIMTYETSTLEEFMAIEMKNEISHKSDTIISYAPKRLNMHSPELRRSMYGSISSTPTRTDIARLPNTHNNICVKDDDGDILAVRQVSGIIYMVPESASGFTMDLELNLIIVTDGVNTYTMNIRTSINYILEDFMRLTIQNIKFTETGTLEHMVLKDPHQRRAYHININSNMSYNITLVNE